MESPSFAALRGAIATRQADLVTIRRDLHRHPELSWQEERTTAVICERLAEAGITHRRLSTSGVVADIGPADAERRVLLRADIDALPVRERTGLDWASVSPGVAHACGHDVHTTALLGAAFALKQQTEALAEAGAAVRMVFQPAEESIPGGAELAIAEGALEQVHAAYALHCDPSLDVGKVGLREGAVTAAADRIEVKLTGRGGHTSRPHLTEDLTFALAKIVTEVPALLSRRVDPRAGALIVWGQMHAGAAGNVIPSSGSATGTLRVLDAEVWADLGPLVKELIESVARPYGVGVEVTYTPGVPPVVNSMLGITDLRTAATNLGLEPVPTRQSMGGEDFAWFLHHAPGAMARLGTRAVGGRTYDLHQGDLIVDEAAIGAGAMLLAGAALAAIGRG